MRNPAPNSNIPTYHLTEKGLRACGASTMEKAANQLLRLADQVSRAVPAAAAELRHLAGQQQRAAHQLIQEPPTPQNILPLEPVPASELKILRYGTVCGRYRDASNQRVSDLRLCGLWLQAAGFSLGQKYEVEVKQGKLTIRARAAHPPRRRTLPKAQPQGTRRQPFKNRPVTKRA